MLFLLQKVSACGKKEYAEEDDDEDAAEADDDDDEEIMAVDVDDSDRAASSRPSCTATSSKPYGSNGVPHKRHGISSSSDLAEVTYFRFGRAKLFRDFTELHK